MKKLTKIMYMVILAFAVCGCSAKSDEALAGSSEGNLQDYPRIVLINNASYYGSDEKCAAVPRKAPDGTIETFVDAEIMPDVNGTANFGAEQGQLEYMFVEDGRLIVHIGEDWYYFDKQGENTVEGTYKAYEIETFDGEVIVIDDSNIISQQAVEDVLETTLVPSEAEVIAPGRDYVYLADDNNYYVEDAVDNLLTIATKE